ncbi:MAG: polyprenyl synthetase family protein [Candidatus Thorarchaeota archaeon]
MSFSEVLKREIASVNKALEKFLDTKVERAKKLYPLHEEFYSNLKEYILRGGKRFRPIAVVIGCKVVGGDIDNDSLYTAASSIEILHNASLVHDDVIDHDATRRGGPTFHKRYHDQYKTIVSNDTEKATHFGMTCAILGGDSLINTGAMAITEANLDPDIGMQCLDYYHRGFEEIIEGVFLEMNMINDSDVTPEMYLKMIQLKTASLLEKSLLMGGAIGRASESQMKALSVYGIKIGQAFQIQDDILGTFGDVQVTGKSTDGDIKEGKKTMLMLGALKLASPEQKAILEKYSGNDKLTPDEVEKVRDVFRESGALEYARKMMTDLLTEGQGALDKAEPALVEKYKQYMLDLSNFLVKRNY